MCKYPRNQRGLEQALMGVSKIFTEMNRKQHFKRIFFRKTSRLLFVKSLQNQDLTVPVYRIFNRNMLSSSVIHVAAFNVRNYERNLLGGCFRFIYTIKHVHETCMMLYNSILSCILWYNIVLFSSVLIDIVSCNTV